ncbi:MAG: metallophosphoesterase [Promethearchaeota archaeon]
MEPIKFIHVSDLHLGKRQYNLTERYKDYFRAFQWILDLAISEKVDFLLVSGDLFDNKNVNPSVLSDVFYSIRDFIKKEAL